MPDLKDYHRPESVDEALHLLTQAGQQAVPVAGGTELIGRLVTRAVRDVDAVIDLGRLPLRYIEEREGRLHIGSVTTLSEIAENAACRQLANGLLARAAQRHVPMNVRNAATIGGAVAQADPESEVLAALLALNGRVVLRNADGQEQTLNLAEFLADRDGVLHNRLITEIQLPADELAGATGGLAVLARTLRDRAIVAAAAVLSERALRVGLSGVAARPLLLQLSPGDDVAAAVESALEGVEPFETFRGSAAYRRAMGAVMARRALAEARPVRS